MPPARQTPTWLTGCSLRRPGHLPLGWRYKTLMILGLWKQQQARWQRQATSLVSFSRLAQAFLLWKICAPCPRQPSGPECKASLPQPDLAPTSAPREASTPPFS